MVANDIENIRYNNFNLLRLLAAFQVVFKHTVEHLQITNQVLLFFKDVLSYFPGVPIFFLISGYLITLSYERNQNLYEYSRNRYLRIMPGLYVNFLIGLIILRCFDQFNGISLLNILSWCFAQLTIFQFYNPDFIRGFGVGVINGSLWTISVEISFYIILPFLYILLKKSFYKRLILLLSLSFLFYYYVFYMSSNTLIYEKLIRISILPYLFYFLFGFFIYKHISLIEKYISGKVFLYLALYSVVEYLGINNFIFDIFKKLIFSLFVFSFVFSYKNLSYKLMRHNDFTYGIYIYHMFVVNIFVQMGYTGEVQAFFVVFVLSIICGVLSYFLVEKPFLNMKKRSLYKEVLI